MLGSDLTPRLRPLLVFSLLCYSGVALSPRARRRVALLALASGLGGAALLCRDFRSLGHALDDFSSGIPFVRRGSRVYPVIFDPRSPSILVKPFLHAWGYYGLARDVVTPYAFAWHATRFPYRYRELPVHSVELGVSVGRRGRALRAHGGAPLHVGAALLGVALLRRGSRRGPRRESWRSARRTTICSPGQRLPTFGR